MIEETLAELGFTRGEIEVYLTLLKIGETTTGKIIKDAQISGGKIYQILDKLENKGLASHIVKEKTKYFSAVSPEGILDYLKNEKKKLSEKEKEIRRELPFLLRLKNSKSSEHQTTLFSGIKGIEMAIFQSLNKLTNKDEALAMGIREGKGEVFNIMWEKWHKKRAKEKIKGRFIFSERNEKIDKIFKEIKYTKIKYIDGITPSAIGILGNDVLIQTYEDEPSCLLIQNQKIAKSFKSFFENLWSQSKS